MVLKSVKTCAQTFQELGGECLMSNYDFQCLYLVTLLSSESKSTPLFVMFSLTHINPSGDSPDWHRWKKSTKSSVWHNWENRGVSDHMPQKYIFQWVSFLSKV